MLPQDFVYLSDISHSIHQDIKYATNDNFTGNIVLGYNESIAILTIQAAQAISKLQTELKKDNKSLLIWDAYRPTQAVDYFLKWQYTEDILEIKNRFYPNLNKSDLFKQGFIAAGKSTHSRGSTLDLTIIDTKSGKALDMGSEFDFFNDISYTNSKNISNIAQHNRQYLVDLMTKYGFKNYQKEWWHFTLIDEPYNNQYFNFPVE